MTDESFPDLRLLRAFVALADAQLSAEPALARMILIGRDEHLAGGAPDGDLAAAVVHGEQRGRRSGLPAVKRTFTCLQGTLHWWFGT